MIRVQLTLQPHVQNPKGNYVKVLKPDFDSLVDFVCSKTKLGKKNIRIFVCKNSQTAKPGTEIKKDSDIKSILCDDVMIFATKGEDYQVKTVKIDPKKLEQILSKLSKPPGFKSLALLNSKVEIKEEIKEEIEEIQIKEIKTEKVEKIEIEKEFLVEKNENTPFPIFKGSIIQLLKEAIMDCPNIVKTVNHGFTSYDYKEGIEYAKGEKGLIQKECRGLIVSNETGKVLSRRFHKFYNIGEIEETQVEKIDFTNCRVYEKLDGSLVTPILLDNGQLVWATRRQCIKDDFISENIKEFSKNWLRQNITPMFEWCVQDKQPGVLRYEKDKLVLISLRDNISGIYYPLEKFDKLFQKWNIETVKPIEYKSFKELKSQVDQWKDREGVVIYLLNGSLYKLKTPWWVNMSKASLHGSENYLPALIKSMGTIKNIPSYKVLLTAIQKNDDVISQCVTNLNQEEMQQFSKLVEHTSESIQKLLKDLSDWILEAFKLLNSIDPNSDEIKNQLKEANYPDWIVEDTLNKGKIDKDRFNNFLCEIIKRKEGPNVLKYLLDIEWNSDTATLKIEDIPLDIIDLEDCYDDIKEHILSTYLPKKIQTMLGIKKVEPDSIINIPRNYEPSEGKIQGLWEQFTKKEIWDLRIDLQDKLKSGYTSHNGDMDYALLLVQYGLKLSKKKLTGEFAGVFIPTEIPITYQSIYDAMKTSFEKKKLIRVAKRFQKKIKIFCDLDGVLADFQKGVKKITGFEPNDQKISKMWNKILSHPGFFKNLDWTEDGEKLWDYIQPFEPTILTGLPYSCKKDVSKDKEAWCQNNLGKEVNVICCMSKEKYRFATFESILIDDRLENGKAWQTSGGVFIHHSNTERTIYELKKLFGKLEKKTLKMSDTNETFNTQKEIKIIKDKMPIIKDAVVGIDIEWDFRSKTPISIVQIATMKTIYIVDFLEANLIVKDDIKQLMKNKEITKLFFDTDNDIMRLESDLNNIIDLKEWAVDSLVPFWDGTPSLATITQLILKKKLLKTYELQKGSWNERPLTKEQLQYAANDADVLLEIYKQIDKYPWKNIEYEEKHTKLTSSTQEYQPNMPTKVIYAGIFLSQASREELTKRIPPIFKNHYANHVTMIYEPNDQEIYKFPVGESVNVKVIGYYEDKRLQCIQVEIEKSIYHITISTNNVKPEECAHVTEYKPIESFQLQGKYGLLVTYQNDPLVVLPKKIREKIQNFVETAQVGEKLKFKPEELSNAERSVVHDYAKNNGLKSESTGKDKQRKLTLTMLRKKSDDPDHQIYLNIYEHPEEETKSKEENITFKIKDPSIVKIMNLVSNSSRSVRKAGFITNDMIQWENSPDFEKDKVCIILRGLSGSGKSWVSSYLSQEYDLEICSADYYFMKKKIYEFDPNKLQEAHDYCYQQAKDYMSNHQSLIIDNTNSKLSEYKKYIDLARDYEYTYYVIEIFCKNEEQAEYFTNRSSHHVPLKTVMIMFSKWETDDTSYLLEPYIPFEKSNTTLEIGETVQSWLTQNKLFHTNKKRNKTHLFMGTGNRASIFVDVPEELRDEFYKVYFHSGVFNRKDDEPKYLSEWIQDQFRLYFDFDFGELVELDEIIQIGKIISQVVNSEIYVTGSSEGDKTGIHYHCYDCIVGYDQSIEYRDKIIKKLNNKRNWEAIFDKEVYRNGLRMFGSRKVTNNLDVGRVHEFLFMLIEGKVVEMKKEDINWKILRKLSIQV